MNNEYDRMLFYRYIGETLNQSALVHEANLLFKGVFHEELWYFAGGGGGKGGVKQRFFKQVYKGLIATSSHLFLPPVFCGGDSDIYQLI